MPIRAVIFDLGNTLVYFDGRWSHVMTQTDKELAHALQANGFDLDAEEVANRFGQRMKDYRQTREDDLIEHSTAHILQTVMTELGYPEVPETALRDVLAQIYAVSQKHWIPEADVVLTLEALRAEGYMLGVVSNAGDDADVQTLVDKAGIRHCLDFILTSAAFGYRKPDTRIFEFALEYWGLPPEQVAMVGDTLEADILGANQAGMYSVWINRRVDLGGVHDLRKHIRPDAEVESLAALVPLFAGVE